MKPYAEAVEAVLLEAQALGPRIETSSTVLRKGSRTREWDRLARLLAYLNVRGERAAVAFWRNCDNVRVGVGQRPWPWTVRFAFYSVTVIDRAPHGRPNTRFRCN
jgi:hypothetical protein